jgi:hypothetical protein
VVALEVFTGGVEIRRRVQMAGEDELGQVEAVSKKKTAES